MSKFGLKHGIGCAVTSSLLAAAGIAHGSTVTVINFSENGPSDRATSGNTPATFFGLADDSGRSGFTLSGNSAFSQQVDGVSPLASDVASEALSVFVAQSGGEGAAGRSSIQGGELENIGNNQVYVAELLDTVEPGAGPGSGLGFSPIASAEQTTFGHGFSSFVGGTLINGPSTSNPPINPSSPTVPEPGSVILLALGGVMLLHRRRTV